MKFIVVIGENMTAHSTKASANLYARYHARPGDDAEIYELISTIKTENNLPERRD